MALLSEEVKVGLNPQTIKYYGSLGYYIPRIKGRWGITTPRGSEIIIKPSDLKNNSDVKVKVQCDGEDCGVVKKIAWSGYFDSINKHGKYYCLKCANKLFNKSRETKLKNGKPFEMWCLENDRQDVLGRWDYDLNDFKPNEISYSSGKSIFLKCPRGTHPSELNNISRISSSCNANVYCKQCNSFEQWCINNNKLDILDRWDYEKNDKNPTEITYGASKSKYWFKCDKNIHESELKSINRLTNMDIDFGCTLCKSFAQWGITNIGKDFLKDYWDYDKNINSNPWKIECGGSKKVWIICQEKDYHESYDVHCVCFVKGDRCPYCRSLKVHPLDSLGQYIIDSYGEEFLNSVWSDKNIKSVMKYSQGSGKKVWWKCIESNHKDYPRSIGSSNFCDFRCPECVQERDESFLQEKVRLYLETMDYIILHERKCTIIPKNPKSKTNNTLPFDNEIKELKFIIEVHGSQHYKISNWHIQQSKKNNTTPEYELHYQRLKDRYKKFIAYKRGYNYIAIPYWTDNAKKEWKSLIDDKLKEIQKNIITKTLIKVDDLV